MFKLNYKLDILTIGLDNYFWQNKKAPLYTNEKLNYQV